MKVRIHVEVFEREEVWPDLSYVLRIFISRQHIWDLDDWQTIQESRWLTSNPEHGTTRRYREDFDKCLSMTAYTSDVPSSKSITIGLTSDGSNSIIAISDAYDLLRRPAWIVTENAQSDGAFLAAMSVSHEHTYVVEALRQRWLRLQQAGGGGELAKRALDLVNSGYDQSQIMILTDSDCLRPEDLKRLLEEKEESLRKSCTKKAEKVDIFILSKREIENYLPVSALVSHGESKRYRIVYQAYLNLNQRQRDFYDMKEGFRRDSLGKAIVRPEQQALYGKDKLPRGVLDNLCGGFGDNVWRLFGGDGADLSVPPVDQVNPAITREAVAALFMYPDREVDDASIHEINKLLERIERML